MLLIIVFKLHPHRVISGHQDAVSSPKKGDLLLSPIMMAEANVQKGGGSYLGFIFSQPLSCTAEESDLAGD